MISADSAWCVWRTPIARYIFYSCQRIIHWRLTPISFNSPAWARRERICRGARRVRRQQGQQPLQPLHPVVCQRPGFDTWPHGLDGGGPQRAPGRQLGQGVVAHHQHLAGRATFAGQDLFKEGLLAVPGTGGWCVNRVDEHLFEPRAYSQCPSASILLSCRRRKPLVTR